MAYLSPWTLRTTSTVSKTTTRKENGSLLCTLIKCDYCMTEYGLRFANQLFSMKWKIWNVEIAVCHKMYGTQSTPAVFFSFFFNYVVVSLYLVWNKRTTDSHYIEASDIFKFVIFVLSSMTGFLRPNVPPATSPSSQPR